ncbi:hypothetical protein BZG01_16490 [Labilibaculum manganireducens]|uniref:Transporter n=1 Tax=Labilibaculum manganireducens TaxID=1940525 RepID=A0A2N3HY61_9BACT|nr:TolC family protein [Labilibaculum manganireducens]PKQ62981.1 hypothetical protein BZG01_16490 [Labilibaculum manganireducens]
MARYILLLFICAYSFQGSAQSLSLDSCQSLAHENNKRLKEAQMNLQASELVKKNAFTNYFPKLDAGITVFKSDKKLLELGLAGTQMRLLDYANYGHISAIQPIYAGGKVRNGNRLSSLGVEINKENLTLTEDQLKVKTEELFWLSISLQEKMITLLQYEELVNTLLKDVEVSYNAGLIQKSDLLKVQLKQNELSTNKLQLQNSIDMVAMTLCQHLGIKYSEKIRFEDELLTTDLPIQYFEIHNESVVNRSEFKILSKLKRVEELKYKMIKGDILPQFAIGASGMYLDVLDNDNTSLLAFATLSIPISDWWGGGHRLKESKVHIRIAQNKIDETSELLELEMEKEYRDLNEEYQRITVSQKSVIQAEEHHKVIKDNYSAGLVNTSDLLEAQAMLQEAKDGETDALCTYKIRLANYLKSIGK